MMRQYMDAKKAHPDCLLLFRMGDFYEMFGEDARRGAELLDLVVTSRDREEPKMPMAGIPHHALEGYLGRLMKAGVRVAICDQVEDPATAKGIVKREVVRLVTPGTVTDPGLLEERRGNYVAAVAQAGGAWGLAWADISTGEFQVAEPAGPDGPMGEIARAAPSEVVLPEGAPFGAEIERRLRAEAGLTVTPWRPEAFHPVVATALLKERFKLASLEGLGIADNSAAAAAAGAALAYVESTQMGRPTALKAPRAVHASRHLELDPVTQRNLEVVRSLRDGSSRGTLLALLDRTQTALGGRRIREWLVRPLTDTAEIARRLDAVEFLVGHAMLRERMRQVLRGVHDVERLVARATGGIAGPRDVDALAASLEAAAELKAALTAGRAGGVPRPALVEQAVEGLGDFQGLSRTLRQALVEEPPAGSREGGIFRPGYSTRLDELKAETQGARDWIGGLQGRERERTQIKGLKVGYNKVFGYYIEVSRGAADKVPSDYERKQTLVNAERYVTPELKRHEELVLSADEQINAVEAELFEALVGEVRGEAPGLLLLADAVATLDTANALAGVAADRAYCRPVVDGSTVLSIRDGRHPVVETAALDGEFVPNDTNLDTERNQLAIITGPNMAGKSTYMRQVALITIMAQMGSFVPAAEARVGVVDRILTRVGASDDVASGQSTFMVEMVETARILNMASDRSLVLLDEIGRGTSTFDGLSIAWAVAEHLHGGAGAHPRTLFATHYHQLTDLDRDHPRVVNYHLTAREHAGGIVFLRKLLPGSTDKSYGIQVAKLAGVPQAVVDRAAEVLAAIEERHALDLAASAAAGASGGDLAHAVPPSPVRAFTQTLLFSSSKEGQEAARQVLEQLREMDLDRMTPIQALEVLEGLRRTASGEGGGEPSTAVSAPSGAKARAKRSPRKRGEADG
jgi:DNA mismatch repair protein MutS